MCPLYEFHLPTPLDQRVYNILFNAFANTSYMAMMIQYINILTQNIAIAIIYMYNSYNYIFIAYSYSS